MILPLGLWYESPSTFTFIFWGVLWLWGLRHLKLEYYQDVKRIRGIYRLVNGTMIVGFVAFIYDTLWILFQIVHFGHLYPMDIGELAIRFCQNMGLLVVCTLFILHLFEKGVLAVQRSTWVCLIFLGFYFALWFGVAPDPSWTDWTYAIRHSYDGIRVIQAFFISHVVGKGLQGLIFFSLWRT